MFLLRHIPRWCLVDMHHLSNIVCSSAPPTSSHLHPLVSYENQFTKLIADFLDLMGPTFPASIPPNTMFHQIQTLHLQVWTRFWCLAPQKLCSQGRVHLNDQIWYHPTLVEPVCFTLAYGAQE